MIRLFSLISLLLMLVAQGFSQDSIRYTWKERKFYALDSVDVWIVDALGNIFTARNGLLTKYDSTGVQKFSQSIKSLGETTQLQVVNTMKIVQFSEGQQTVCYFDNTLTKTQECMNLIDYGIENSSMIAVSGQPNKLWVLDNINSTLHLLSLDGTNQSQEIKNLSGILNLDQIVNMTESGNRLYLLEKNKGLYVFDMYGSLLEHIPVAVLDVFITSENNFISLTNDSLVYKSLLTGQSLTFSLPVDGVIEFDYNNFGYYFRTAEGVYNYSLQIDGK